MRTHPHRRRWLLRAGLGLLILAQCCVTVALGIAEGRAGAFETHAASLQSLWKADIAAGVPATLLAPVESAVAARAAVPGWSLSWLDDPGASIITAAQAQTDAIYSSQFQAAQLRAEAALDSLATAEAAARVTQTGSGIDDLRPDLDDVASASAPVELNNLASSWESQAALARGGVDARTARLEHDEAAWESLTASLNSDVSGSGGSMAIVLDELGGPTPRSLAINSTASFDAASTFKLPLLVAEGQLLAAHSISLTDTLCYTDSDWSPGYFWDYADGVCFSRGDLLTRVGQYSDNTAANILIRDLGGPDALNQQASQQGAVDSQFWYPNTTTASDLAAIWRTEAGGSAAEHSAVYPLLTHTLYEAGIPAGVPAGVTVVHKVGDDGTVVHDAGLVQGSPNGDYILVVMTQLPSGDGASWSEIAQISQTVWNYESNR